MKDPQIPELVVHSDNTVHRRAICQCGKVIYKKNVTSGEYTLHDKNYASKLLPGGNQGEYIFPCDCGIGHIVRHLKEETTIVDKINVGTGPFVVI